MLMTHFTNRCRCEHVLQHDSAWKTFILKCKQSLYPDLGFLRSTSSAAAPVATAATTAGLWVRFVAVDGPGDGGVQSDGYINGPAAVHSGNCEGYLCGPQQRDSTGEHWTRHKHSETD